MFDIDPALIENPPYIESGRPLDTPIYMNQQMVAVMTEDYDAQRNQVKACAEKPVLTLYIRPTCPYCQKVMAYLQSVNKTIPTKDIGKDPGAADELIKVGGKRQVPCLVINGKAKYESSDIIKWLKDNPKKY